MKWALSLILLTVSSATFAQAWKTLPKGVRLLGYRNVTTSKINSNFNQFRSEASLGTSFKIDADSLNKMTNNALANGISSSAFNSLVVGEYKVDASAQAQVNGTGFGYGITDRIMFYGEIAYYNAQVDANIKRTAGNNLAQVANQLAHGTSTEQALAANIRNLVDVNAGTIQSVITNYYHYKPIGNWQGQGYGDMETGVMANVVDYSTWGLLLYPGVILPTGRQDDPDILQDLGFGDGQYKFFTEAASGYIFNDYFKIGSTFRYTYQAPSNKTLRVQQSEDFTLSPQKGNFDVKYGDRVNWMFNSTYTINDWISLTPVYRFMYQLPTAYTSQYTQANKWMGNNTDKQEHQVQLTTTFSSITPFLKKQFLLPAQININAVQTVAGKNVPKAARFEIEFRMLF
jgi:hypothetical protein